MAGGTWVTQNKVRPGFYINFKGEPHNSIGLGSRGVLAVVGEFGYGSTSVVEVTSEEILNNPVKYLGVDFSGKDLYEFFVACQYVSKFVLRRVTGQASAKSTVSINKVKATAKHVGVGGNKLSIEGVADVENLGNITINTYYNDTLLSSQSVEDETGLVSNDYVDFEVATSGTFGVFAKTPLVGGTNVQALASDVSLALGELENKDFSVLSSMFNDSSINMLISAYAVRQFEEEGKYFQTVVFNLPYDSEHVISIKNGLTNSANEYEGDTNTTVILGAMEAGSQINESLSYTTIKGVDGVKNPLNNSDTIDALLEGQIVFTQREFGVVIEKDINTLVSFLPNKNESFQKNRLVKTLQSISKDLKSTFERNYVGKVDGNKDGLELFKSAVVSYLNNLQSINAIRDFNSQSDVIVQLGDTIDSIIVTIYIQPVDSVEKIYMSVEVR